MYKVVVIDPNGNRHEQLVYRRDISLAIEFATSTGFVVKQFEDIEGEWQFRRSYNNR